jgi:hypothetical protein
LPARYVIEQDLGSFAYRRYQKTLGVEVSIEGNPGVGHTASYLQRAQGRVAVATAFVTVYERAASLAAEARELLESLPGYKLSTVSLEGDHVWQLQGGANERWFAWVSGRYLVKLGAPEGSDVPEELAEGYLELYPSDLTEHGRAEHDAPSAGKSRKEKAEAPEGELEVPRHLRESAPR